MSSRAIIRNSMRREGEKLGVNPSKYLHVTFHKYQVKKVGLVQRVINQAKGTHPRRTWKSRIETAVDSIKRKHK